MFLRLEIFRYVEEFVLQNGGSYCREPIFGISNSNDPLYSSFQKYSRNDKYLHPCDILEDAESVISIFIPFREDVSSSNVKGEFCSEDWAMAYFKSATFVDEMSYGLEDFVNAELSDLYQREIFSCSHLPFTSNYDPDDLYCDFSNNHAAYISGLGNFGVNNMLITEKGTVGRFYNIITNILEIKPSEVEEEVLKMERKKERCLFRKDGSCLCCVKRCVGGAYALLEGKEGEIEEVEFIGRNCAERCRLNMDITDEFYNEYCGKCVVGVPCTFQTPKSKTKK